MRFLTDRTNPCTEEKTGYEAPFPEKKIECPPDDEKVAHDQLQQWKAR
jgi:hypothetical protein